MTKRTPSAQRRRITSHLALVTPIAIGYACRTGQDRDDLIQVGRLGLIRAAQRFEPGMGVAFSAFAKPHIRGAILHYLRDSIGLVRLPRRLQETAQNLIKQERDNPDGAARKAAAVNRLALDTYRSQTTWASIDDLLPVQAWNAETDDEWESLLRRERHEVLSRCWKQLRPLEQKCLQSVVIEGQSLRCAALELGISAMTVQRRVKQGLSALANAWRHQGQMD